MEQEGTFTIKANWFEDDGDDVDIIMDWGAIKEQIESHVENMEVWYENEYGDQIVLKFSLKSLEID